MKEIFKKIIIFILTTEARIVLWRFKPQIIAVTGSVGKTTTKDAIYTSLKDHVFVRRNQKSFNSEFGVPLTILGLQTGWNSISHWLWNIVLGFFVIFKNKYPKWLVLETGVDHPGDMESIAKWLKPDIAVFTAFGTVPVHVEFFGSPEGIWDEKKKLINYLKKDGAIILNQDDENVMKIKEIAKREVYTYGFHKDSDVQISHVDFIYNEDGSPKGISFKLNVGDASIPVNINGILGKHLAYSAAAALAVGVSQKMSLVEMASAFSDHQSPAGRLRILKGKNNSTIIDDSYNSSPAAAIAALNTLAEVKVGNGGRRIAILGDMLEIGNYTAKEHKRMGDLALELGIDYLVGVGVRSEFTTEQAIESGMEKDKVKYFKTSEEAIEGLAGLVKEGDVILVKGSQGIRTEKIVKSLLANPSEASELLVRQDSIWEMK